MEFLSHTNLLIGLLMFSSFYFGLSSVNDSITSDKSIRDHETISSNNSDFKLGFFSPANSTNRYAGIWYLSESNVIWIANRDQPLKDSSGVVRINKDGNLVVLKGQNLIIWSTNVSNNARDSSAQLDDSGNLILRDDTTGTKIWESFQHPCDAFILGKMKISSNRITGKKTLFTSWKTTSDPSAGYFSYSLENLDAPELIYWVNGTRKYLRTGPWNGRVFIGLSQMTTEYLFGWILGHDDDGTVFLTYSFADPSQLGIIFLTPYGRLKVVGFYNKKQLTANEVDQNNCDIYGTCGPFGSCNTRSSPICSCLPGFEPRISEEWSIKNWTSGCVRRAKLQCEKFKNASDVSQDGFLVMHNMKVPDFVERSDANQDKCRTYCLANCSCLAYAYDPGVGCMYWSRELIDMQEFQGEGVDLYIRVPKSELGKSTGYKRAIIAVAGAIGLLTLAASAFLWKRKWTAKQRGSVIKYQKKVHGEDLPLVDFEKLITATNNFHSSNMIGKGGFGPVYKGQLEDGQEIAVKRLSKASGQGIEEFMNEVVVISKLQHRNLVRLLGCCIEGEEQILIYEFMPNKSLDAFLFDPNQRKVLDWKKRFKIIEGIARGLLYLHRDSTLKIIHRDLKASNILLDNEMNPKISDFGLARIFRDGEDEEANTRRVAGTFGYMPPEYAMEGLFSEKSDVYSFGVLLLEIISGTRNTSSLKNEQSLSLVGFAWKLWKEGDIISIIDPDIWDPVFEQSMLRSIHIGLLCVQELTRERPTISTVVLMLISEITNLPPPRQVAFVPKQDLPSSESAQRRQCDSNNHVTLSDIQGR